MIIDATNMILGRMATFAARKAMQGETIEVINAEKAVVSGTRTEVLARYMHDAKRGSAVKGPHIHRAAHLLVRRTIRGMLPHKQKRGRNAYARVKCYQGVPPEFQGKKTEKLETKMADDLPNMRYVTIGEISKHIGGK